MSARPIQEKKLRNLRKLINRRPLPAYINLLWWLRDRGYADTNGQAKKLLMDGRVKSDSHVIGRERVERKLGEATVKVWAAEPLVPADLRNTITVTDA